MAGNGSLSPLSPLLASDRCERRATGTEAPFSARTLGAGGAARFDAERRPPARRPPATASGTAAPAGLARRRGGLNFLALESIQPKLGTPMPPDFSASDIPGSIATTRVLVLDYRNFGPEGILSFIVAG